jgi:hypothetical protein
MGLGIALCLAVSTVALAVAPLLSQVFQMEPGSAGVDQHNLGVAIDLSQTIDGTTIGLQRAYADANRIILGYTITQGDATPYQVAIRVSDDHGTVFPDLGAAGSGSVDGQAGEVSSFDTAAVAGMPAELHLHVVMTLTPLITGAARAADTPPPQTPRTAMASAALERAGPPRGPFTFDVTVPFLAARVAEVHRTVLAAGIPLTLERLIVTPSETRAIVRFTPPTSAGNTDWTPIVALEASDWASTATGHPQGALGPELVQRLADGSWIYRFLDALDDKSGPWTVSVTELAGTDITGLVPTSTRLPGPWVFHVTVPTATAPVHP